MAKFETVPELQTRSFDHWVSVFFEQDDRVSQWINTNDSGHESHHSELTKDNNLINDLSLHGNIYIDNSLCFICKKGMSSSVKLSPCFHCNMTQYCCIEHQNMDYKIHKKFCKYAVMLFNEEKDETLKSSEEYRNYLIKGINYIMIESQENDKNHKSVLHYSPEYGDVWSHQKHCRICFSRKRPLTKCPTCYTQHVCDNYNCENAFPHTHTKRHCELYLIGYGAFISEKVFSKQIGFATKAPIFFPTTSTNKSTTKTLSKCISIYSSLSLPTTSWHDYFSITMDNFNIPTRDIIQPPNMALLTDRLTDSLTIVYAIQCSLSDDLIAQKRKIIIHVLNCKLSHLESCLYKYEEILHWFPNCYELVIVHTGTHQNYISSSNSSKTNCNSNSINKKHNKYINMFSNDSSNNSLSNINTITPADNITTDSTLSDNTTTHQEHDDIHCLNGTVCQQCKSSGKTIKIYNFLQGKTYDKLYSEGILIEKPTLIYCPHAGISNLHPTCFGEPIPPTPWLSTLNLIKGWSEVICAFTSARQGEMLSDVRMLTGLGIRVIKGHHRNPYRSLRPRVETPEFGGDDEFYYNNQEIVIACGQLLKESLFGDPDIK